MIELVLLVCLILLVVLVWKPAKNAILGALDGRSNKIRQDLDEARRLHEEAKALVAKYQQKLKEGEALAAEIVAHGEADRKRFEAKLRADFEASVKRRTEQAMERIAQEEARALAEVKARAADLAIRTTRQLLSDKVGTSETQSLIEGAIREVKQKLA
ncbi:MAG: F0F1 ATP synthase subunit B [Geminicoccaceae bacterium]